MAEIKKILNDNALNTKLRLITESELKGKNTNSSALGVLTGVCSDFAEPTRNDRFYSRKLWENVLSSDYIKEAMDTKTLYGEVDHPTDRDELSLQEAAICCTDLWIDDKSNTLMGNFDILPTERGKLLYELCKYGSRVGVSSRGIGDLVMDGQGRSCVDESSYIFVCFDAVVQPAAFKARQDFSESNSVSASKVDKDSLIEKIVDNIKSAKDKNSIQFMEHIAKSVSLCENKSIKNAIKERQEILSQETTDTNAPVAINETIDTLRNDLNEAYKKIHAYEKRLNNSNNADLEIMRLQISDIKDALTEMLKQKESEIKSLQERLDSANEKSDSIKNSLKNMKESFEKECSHNESVMSLYQKLKSNMLDITERLKESTKETDDTKQALKEAKGTIKEIQDKLDKKLSESKKLVESINKEKDNAEKTTLEVKSIQQELNEALESRRTLLMEYIGRQEKLYGQDLSQIERTLEENTTLDDIDYMVSSLEQPQQRKHPPTVNSAIREKKERLPRITEDFNIEHNDNSSGNENLVGKIFNQFRGN